MAFAVAEQPKQFSAGWVVDGCAAIVAIEDTSSKPNDETTAKGMEMTGYLYGFFLGVNHACLLPGSGDASPLMDLPTGRGWIIGSVGSIRDFMSKLPRDTDSNKSLLIWYVQNHPSATAKDKEWAGLEYGRLLIQNEFKAGRLK